MAERTLLESTEKKASTAKKASASKKSVRVSASRKKTVKQEGKARKAASGIKKSASEAKAKPKTAAKAKGKKPTGTKGKPADKSKSAANAKARKATTARKSKVSKKKLLFRNFDVGPAKKATAKRPAARKKPTKIPEAPPFVTGYDEKETGRIRALLFKDFDLKREAAVERIKEPPPIEPDTVPLLPTKDLPVYQPPTSVSSAGTGAISNIMKFGSCALAVLIAIIIGTSMSNRNKFYLKEVNGAVQVWRGKFAPAGKELVLSLDGIKAPNPAKDIYSKKEICPLVFGYCEDKADAILNDRMGPNFAEIKGYLYQAEPYAPTTALRKRVQQRLKGMDFVVLLHKADVALAKGRLADLRVARACIDKARTFVFTDYQRELLGKMRTVVDEAVVASKTG